MKHLEGITVIEFGEYVSVPMCARLLSEWGARVIKVERPDGDRQRMQGLTFGMYDFTKMPYNHNMDMMAGGSKEYISVNTKTKEGIAIMHRLLSSADILLTNMRPKALKRMNMDYDSLKDKYPKLIYGYVTGYGEKGGALVDAPGYDATCFSARGGVMAGFSQKGNAPCNVPQAFGDIAAAITLTSGVCAALAGRMIHGKGDRVSVSLYHDALFLNTMGVVCSAEPYNNVYPKSRLDQPNPLNNTYQCKDGKWLLYCEPVYNEGVKKLFPLLDRTDYLNDPKWSDLSVIPTIPGQKRKVIEMLDEAFLARTRDEWLAKFDEMDLPGSPCFECDELATDRFALDNDFIRKIKYPDGFEGLIVDVPVRFASEDLYEYKIAKLTGSDTYDTLESFGYSKEELKNMEEKGVITTKQITK